MKAKFTLLTRFKYLLIFLFILLNGVSQQAKAQMVFVPDSNFRNALIAQGFGSCFVGDSIDASCSMVVNDTALFLAFKGIHDLSGINAFNNLKNLSCYNNQLTLLPTLPNTLTVLSSSYNQLTSLPTLPNTLTALDCGSNQLTSLPALPNTLTELYCYNNQLTSLPTLPNNLIYLWCYNNQLNSLPTLPNYLTDLQCYNNQLNSMPTLPNNLFDLYCYQNQLTSLPSLPNTLTYFECDHNQLTSLPTLPSTLNTLVCSSNQLTSLPALPNNLITLWCNNNQLTSLPTLPSTLTILLCNNNQLTSLPALPNNLFRLWCNDNQLTSLPMLPNTLTGLSCSINQLTSLPTLPNNLIYSWCDGNQLTSLPTLPNTLAELTCGLNQLTSLPVLPNTLTNLECENNQLSNLPDLPDSLYHFYCYGNSNLHCLPELKKINNLQFDSLNITCLPNYGQVINSSPSLANVPLCGFFNPNACNIYWNISGNTYYDADTNCVYNGGDNRLCNYNIKLFKNGILNQQAFTGGEGYYSFDTDSFTAYQTIIDTTGIPFNVRCPQSLTYNDTLVVNDTLKYNRDFSLECKPGFDLAAWSIAMHGLVPGHTVTVNNSVGDYTNLFGGKCASGIGGIVSIIYNGSVHYVSPASGALMPTTISGDTLKYSVPDFGLVNASTAFNFLVSVNTTAQIGSQVCINVAVSPATDNEPANNTISHCFAVHGSYDPNEKEVSPQSNLDINGDRWLTYTINFQNTGTAPAEHIYILDTLNANLDVSTFQLLAYSKQPYVQILNGGIAKFNFPNINLPDSTSNEPNSHGYVQYRIKALNNLPTGTTISNTAYIYFDFNSSVVTNTVFDSVINCPSNIQNISVNICSGEYEFNGLYLTQSGNYTQKFTTASGCDSIVNLALTLINNTVVQSHDTLTALENNATYQWYDCVLGTIISGATSQTFVPSVSGYYSVIVTIGNCSDSSACQYISITALNENILNTILISPNPTKDQYIINCPTTVKGTITIKVFDAFGKLIEQKQLATGNTIIKAENWSAGIYYMQITTGQNTSVRKLVKE